jgi:hypothetical protein
MGFSSWLRNLRSTGHSRRTGRPGPAPRFLPRLEALEDRAVPAQIGLTVSSLADSGAGSLRAAILTADAGSSSDQFTIGFSVTGTIDLLSPLPDLSNSIAVQGPGAASLLVERAAGASFSSAIVTVDAGQTASLSGLTIANGDAGGIANHGTLALANSAVLNNNSGHVGGGILNNGTLSISSCTLSGNSTGRGGGGIFNGGGTVDISSSTLAGNSAPVGGGGGIASDFGTLTVRDSILSGNSARSGGGIENFFATVTLSGCTLTGNTATAFTANGFVIGGTGGGIDNNGMLTVRASTLSGNSASVEGGGIFNEEESGVLAVRGSTFSGNSAGDSGGGISNAGTATVQEGTLSGNSAGSAGGGLFNAASGTLTVDDSIVLNNVAPLGADLYNLGALTINDSTVCVIGP